MTQSFLCTLLSGLSWLLLAVAAHAQSPASKPEPPGWTSSWVQPASEPRRRYQALSQQYNQLMRAGKYSEAVAKCGEGIKAFPDDWSFRARRAQVLTNLNRLDAALQDIDHGDRQAAAHKDTEGRSRFMKLRSDIEARRRNYPLAAKYLQTAYRFDPTDASYANSLAWMEATCPRPEVRNGPEAVKLAKRSLVLEPKRAYSTLDTMAAAYAEAGDYPHAVETEKQAIAYARKFLAKDAQLTKFLRGAASRLQLYERGQPYHNDTWADDFWGD